MKKKTLLFLIIGIVLVAVIAAGIVLWQTGAFEPDSEEVAAAKKSVAEYEQILESAPQNEAANAGLITAYAEAGNLEKARGAAKTAAALLPGSKDIVMAMVNAYEKEGMYAEAVLFLSELNAGGAKALVEADLEARNFPGYGNANSGNSVNESRILVDGETIYYSEPRDGGRMYSMDLDGNNKKKLTESEVRYINLVDDKLIYCDVSNSYFGCSANKDGSDQKFVLPMMGKNHFIFDDKIYFANWADECRIYRANLDGSDLEKISDIGAEDLYQYGAWIYFAARDADQVLYRIKINGESLTQVNSDQSMRPNVHNGILYFINWTDNGTLYSVNPENANETYKQVLDKRVGHLNINDGYLYYTDWSLGGKPHRMNLDTFEVTKLGDDRANYLVVAGDWLYYLNSDDANRIYRVKTTGGGRMRVGG